MFGRNSQDNSRSSSLRPRQANGQAQTDPRPTNHSHGLGLGTLEDEPVVLPNPEHQPSITPANSGLITPDSVNTPDASSIDSAESTPHLSPQSSRSNSPALAPAPSPPRTRTSTVVPSVVISAAPPFHTPKMSQPERPKNRGAAAAAVAVVKPTDAFYKAAKWLTDADIRLSRSAGNFYEWRTDLESSVRACPGFSGYIPISGAEDRLIPYPTIKDATALTEAEQLSINTWWDNNDMIFDYLKNTLSDTEREELGAAKDPDDKDIITATAAYRWLEKRNIGGADFEKLNMFNRMAAVIIERTSREEMELAVLAITRTCERLYKAGFSQDDFTKLMLMRALGDSMANTKTFIDELAAKGEDFSSATIRNHINLTAAKVEEEKQINAAFRTQGKPGASSGGYGPSSGTNQWPCYNCGKVGHRWQACTAPTNQAKIDAGKREAKKRYDARQATKAPHAANATTSAPVSMPPTPTANAAVIEYEEFAASASFLGPSPSDFEALLIAEHQPTSAPLVELTPTSAVGADSTSWRHPTTTLTTNDAIIAMAGKDTSWLLDSGASTHCTNDLTELFDRAKVTPIRIKSFNGSISVADTTGSVRFTFKPGHTLVVKNVLYIPGASVKLLSTGMLADAGYDTRFSVEGAVVFRAKDNKAVCAASRQARSLYKLHYEDIDLHINVAAPVPLETMHGRFGHAGNEAILRLLRGNHAEGMHVDLSVHPPLCQCCIQGKQTKQPVAKVREGERTTERLARVHIDLSGPMSVTGIDGSQYVCTIKDTSTRKNWTYTLRSKDQAMPTVTSWHTLVTTQTGAPVRAIIMDNGELRSRAFADWALSKGIELQFTAPHTSQENGSVERMHRTLAGRARSMRLAAGLPEHLWPEFYRTAALLANLLPTAALPCGRTPHEMWIGKKPDVSFLREIGCKAFVLVQNVYNPKVFSRSHEGVFVGYDTTSKAYRVWCPSMRKIIVSRNVRFVESHLLKPRPWREGVLAETAPPTTPEADQWPKPHEIEGDAQLSQPLQHPVPAPALTPPTPAIQSPPAAPPQPRRSARLQQKKDAPEHIIQTLQEIRTGEARARDRRALGKAVSVNVMLEVTKDHDDPISSFLAATTELQEEGGGKVSVEQLFGEMLDDLVVQCLVAEHEEKCAAAAEARVLPPEPLSIKEALAGPEAELWREALRQEFASIKDLKVFNLIRRERVPAGRAILKGKPVLKRKLDENGEVTRYKARWVAKGFLQVFGQDFHETTSPTARMESVRILAHIAAVHDLEMRQFDVKTAFLHGPLDTPVYMEQPPGFDDPEKPASEWVWELVKGLYGLKQGGLCWNAELHKSMLEFGFKQVLVEHCIYIRKTGDEYVIAGVHVDDFMAIGTSVEALDKFETDLRSKWEISVGDCSFLLGIHFVRDRANRTIHLSQTAMIDRIVKEFGQEGCRPISTPMDSKAKLSKADCPDPNDEEARAALLCLPYRKLIGSLIFVAAATRPDISFAVNFLSRYLDCFGQAHWDAGIRVIQYLHTTRLHGLLLGHVPGNAEKVKLLGMTDSDYANDKDGRLSVSGYTFNLGAGAISWRSRKQACVAQSTCEAEYIAACAAAKEAIWLRQLLHEIDFTQQGPTPILGDNRGTIALVKSQTHHEQSKHIDVRYHFIREKHNSGEISLSYIRTHNNLADIFTKPLPRPIFSPLRRKLGVCELGALSSTIKAPANKALDDLHASDNYD
jgi:hypothetical protein